MYVHNTLYKDICNLQPSTDSQYSVGVRNEFERDLRGVEHYLSSSENKA